MGMGKPKDYITRRSLEHEWCLMVWEWRPPKQESSSEGPDTHPEGARGKKEDGLLFSPCSLFDIYFSSMAHMF